MSSNVEQAAESRAQKVIEAGPTHVFRLEHNKENPLGQTIVAGVRDRGPAGCLAPVIDELADRGYKVVLVADNPAEGFLKKRYEQDSYRQNGFRLELVRDETGKEIDPLLAIAATRPALILSGVSLTGNPATELYLTKTGEGQIPSIWVEDYWGVATGAWANDSGQMKITSFNLQPDVICAFDQKSKVIDLERLKKAGREINEDSIIVTGSPVFDEIVRQNNEAINKRVRETLSVDNQDLLVTYVGGAPPLDLSILKTTVESINQINNHGRHLKFIARIHPSIFGSGDLSRYKSDYEKILGLVTSAQVVSTADKDLSTEELATASNVVVSPYSTVGIRKVFEGGFALFMLFPTVRRDLENATGLSNLPVVESGASLAARKSNDVRKMLEDLLFDGNLRAKLNEAQRNYHRLDGQNTARVVQQIEKLLS